MLPMIISAIPSLIKLFNSDSRDSGVKELTSTVISEVGKKLNVDFKSKEEVVKHLNSNPEDAIKLKELDLNYKKDIDAMYLKDKQDARNMNVKIQAAKDWLVRNTGSMIAIFTIASAFILDLVILIMVFNSIEVSPILTLIAGANNVKAGQVLSFYFGASKMEADSKR